MLLAAGLFLVMRAPSMSRGMRVEMWVLMLVVFTQASASIATLLFPDRHAIDWHARGLYLITPVAFGALVWLASVAWREGLGRLEDVRRIEWWTRGEGPVPEPMR